jgi:glyoxylase-like metal-dependent hydrolase (beta-lactamase superfamily II)
MEVKAFFDPTTATLSYLAFDPVERVGVLIDPVADFDPASGGVSHESAAKVAEAIDELGLRIPWVLETHAHADHLSAAPWWKERTGASTVIGFQIIEVQRTFRNFFNLGPDFPVDGSQFDRLVGEGEVIEAGPLRIEAMHTPGHTPACISYRIGDVVFVGDTLFQPDHGTARCDFPGGSAAGLYDSIRRLYALPDETRLFTCHDYQPGGRELRFESTVGEQKAHNVQLDEKTRREDFIQFREARDATLTMPTLILPAIQVNIRGGELPAPESNGRSYLKIPLNAFGGPR